MGSSDGQGQVFIFLMRGSSNKSVQCYLQGASDLSDLCDLCCTQIPRLFIGRCSPCSPRGVGRLQRPVGANGPCRRWGCGAVTHCSVPAASV